MTVPDMNRFLHVQGATILSSTMGLIDTRNETQQGLLKVLTTD